MSSSRLGSVISWMITCVLFLAYSITGDTRWLPNVWFCLGFAIVLALWAIREKESET